MYEDDIQKVDEWFEKHSDDYGTYHSDNTYSVSEYNLEAFSDFLNEEFTDLCYIRVYFSKGDSAIWFFEDDLKDAKFY